MLLAGSSGVAMDVTQPAWPFSVARSVRVSAILSYGLPGDCFDLVVVLSCWSLEKRARLASTARFSERTMSVPPRRGAPPSASFRWPTFPAHTDTRSH